MKKLIVLFVLALFAVAATPKADAFTVIDGNDGSYRLVSYNCRWLTRVSQIRYNNGRVGPKVYGKPFYSCQHKLVWYK